MHRLTLIRHALTEWNVSGRFQGQTDVALSEEGRAQARRLARHVRGLEQGAVVYASPLARARETAEIAFPRREIRLDARLRELDFGSFEGNTLEENERHERWSWWIADPYQRTAPAGESYRQLRERAVAWMDELFASESAADHVVAVSHSGTIQMLLAHVLGVERPRWRKRIYLRHTGISRVLFRSGEAVVERVNDTRHLAAEGADPFLD